MARLVLVAAAVASLLALEVVSGERLRAVQLFHGANATLQGLPSVSSLRCKLRATLDMATVAPMSEHWAALPAKGTCAVISSAGCLLNHKLGREIDAADMVIRFNTAKTKGFEEMVGAKDDLRIINMMVPEQFVDEGGFPSNKTTYVVSAPVADKDADAVALHQRWPDNKIYRIPTPALGRLQTALREAYPPHWFSGEEWKTQWPTTGAVGMLVALSLCKEVRAYGMAGTPGSLGGNMHYFPPEWGGGAGVEQTTDSVHLSLRAEKDIWRRLATNPTSEVDKTEVAIIPGFAADKC